MGQWSNMTNCLIYMWTVDDFHKLNMFNHYPKIKSHKPLIGLKANIMAYLSFILNC